MIVTFIYYLFLLGIFIFGSVWSWNLITIQQKDMNSAYDAIDDMDKCPNTAKYISKFQSGFITSYFALLASCITGCFMIILFIGLLTFEQSRPILNYSLIYLTIMIIAVFISSYKISNSSLLRMCGMNSCSSKYFK